MSRDDPQMKLRLPVALRDRIKEAADMNGRSMNAEIVGALARAYPRTNDADELMRDLFGLIIFNRNKLNEDDMVLFEDIYENLQREVDRLQKLEKDNTASD